MRFYPNTIYIYPCHPLESQPRSSYHPIGHPPCYLQTVGFHLLGMKKET